MQMSPDSMVLGRLGRGIGELERGGTWEGRQREWSHSPVIHSRSLDRDRPRHCSIHGAIPIRFTVGGRSGVREKPRRSDKVY